MYVVITPLKIIAIIYVSVLIIKTMQNKINFTLLGMIFSVAYVQSGASSESVLHVMRCISNLR